jgi:hypothetical protein
MPGWQPFLPAGVHRQDCIASGQTSDHYHENRAYGTLRQLLHSLQLRSTKHWAALARVYCSSLAENIGYQQSTVSTEVRNFRNYVSYLYVKLFFLL